MTCLLSICYHRNMDIIYEYTKKPVRVEAALFNGDKHTTERILQWVGNNTNTEGETPRIIADFDPLSETYRVYTSLH